VRVVPAAADQPEVRLPVLHLPQHRRGVGHADPDPHSGVPAAKRRQRPRKQVLAGDGTGGQRQLAGGRPGDAGDRGPGLGVQVDDPAGVLVQPPPGLGQHGPAGPAAEQRRPHGPFELLNPLADRRLGQPERPGGGGEPAPLGGLGERVQVRQQVGRHGPPTGRRSRAGRRHSTRRAGSGQGGSPPNWAELGNTRGKRPPPDHCEASPAVRVLLFAALLWFSPHEFVARTADPDCRFGDRADIRLGLARWLLDHSQPGVSTRVRPGAALWRELRLGMGG
jgi:hypothetical protein